MYSSVNLHDFMIKKRFLFPQGRPCGEDEDTQVQDDELSLSAHEPPLGSDCGESFTLDLPGQAQDQLLNIARGLNPNYCQPPLDFLPR